MDKARRLLSETRRLAGDHPSERWLWVMELGEQLQPEMTLQLAKTMLTAGRLPIARVPTMLNSLEREEGHQVADRLAFAIAKHSDHPVVLERAVRHARQTGNKETSQQLEQRLRAYNHSPTGGEFSPE